ncbi:hypothetical protein [Sphingobium yanoikuyae]|uniref:hypothetical protein n=1 Tax=Sphingobium yanoikuyae TaxID=13690 RepID=UPI0035B32003
MSHNRKRILSEALSLDAWHDPFQIGSSCGVYVELSFHEGRLGGDDPNIPFTFKLGIKRALLTIELENPLEIDRKSVARNIPEVSAELNKILEAKRSAEKKAGANLSLNPSDLHASGSIKSENSRKESISIVQTIPETLVISRPENSRGYSWSMEPSWQNSLHGQPWNPIESPRLRTKPIKSLSAIPPSVKIIVSCALEDINISDLKLKKNGFGSRMSEIIYNEKNEAAAKQHLKLVLRDSDLEPGLLDNRFSNLILANILAIED